MKPDDIWNGFLEQAPHARDPEAIVKMRSRGLKKLIEQAYEEGKKSGALHEAFKRKLSEAADKGGGDPLEQLSDFLKGFKKKP